MSLTSTPATRAAFAIALDCPVRTHARREPVRDADEQKRPQQLTEWRRKMICEWRREEPPVTLREIARRLHTTKTTIGNHIRTLKKTGELPEVRRCGRRGGPL